MKIHHLNIFPEYFNAILLRQKMFEVREKRNRNFAEGDEILLHEFDGKLVTGRTLFVKITYVLDNPDYCKDGFVVLGINF